MKLKSIKLFFLLSIAVAFLLSSCVKNKVKELGDAGATFLKIMEAPENKLFFEPFTGTKTVSLFSLRRDANSNAELNKPVTVTVRLDTAAIRAYNRANSETFERLPDSLFTITGQGITKTGPLTYQIALAPGEFANDFQISLSGSKWDLSRKYAAPFIIEDPGGLTVSSEMNKLTTLISIKNKYDGTYQATGVFHHPTAGDRNISELKALVTAGPNSVRAPLGDLGSAGYYMILTVNPDNTVTITPSGITPNIDQRWGPNYYNPATRTFVLNYSYNVAAPRVIEETLVRK